MNSKIVGGRIEQCGLEKYKACCNHTWTEPASPLLSNSSPLLFLKLSPVLFFFKPLPPKKIHPPLSFLENVFLPQKQPASLLLVQGGCHHLQPPPW